MGATLGRVRGPSREVRLLGDPVMPPAVPAAQGPWLEHEAACAEDLGSLSGLASLLSQQPLGSLCAL